MFRLCAAACVGCLALILVANSGITGDKDKKGDGKIKGAIPAGWKALKLSADQEKAIRDVSKAYKGKIAALEDQITSLKAQERADMVKVLNDDQKELLRKLTIGEGSKDKTVKEDKKEK